MRLLLSRKGQKVTVEKRDGEKLLGRVTASFDDDRHFENACDVLGVEKEQILAAVDTGVEEFDLTPALPVFSVSVRGRQESLERAQLFSSDSASTALRLALAAEFSAPEPLITWEDATRLCAVDVDGDAAHLIDRVQPRPFAAWATHHGGLRLLYEKTETYEASELAAVAALHVASLDPLLRVEIKTDTRHPRYAVGTAQCGPVHAFAQTDDVSFLRSWFNRADVSEEAVTEYLAARSLARGQRYPHSHCPVQPHEPGNRDPVVVRDDGIFCHVCAGRGVSFGHKLAGWFPFTSLVGDSVSGQLELCLENFTHWAHARYVLAEIVPLGERIARGAYAAALKMLHGVDARIPRVFAAGDNFLRFDSRWATEEGETFTKDVTPILETLPACLYVDAVGRVKVSQEKVARFAQPTRLTRYGYPCLSPLFGCKVYGHRLPTRDPNSLPIVVQPPYLTHDCMANFRAKYVTPAGREFTEDQAWGVLNEFFPGLSRQLITLLIAAKGVMEGQLGLPPFIFIRGPTSSAKTASVAVAAGICGDHNTEIAWTNNIERVRQGILDAKDHGSFITFNEIIKECRMTGKPMDEGLTFLLNITPHSVSHKMYVGPVALGTLPVICFTDTSLPAEVIQNAQLARRITYAQLERQIDWRQATKQLGVSELGQLRASEPRVASACNVILSSVIDRFFTYPMTFDEIAEQLGFAQLEDDDLMKEKEDMLRMFFRAVCAAPPLDGFLKQRWPEGEWRLISAPGSETPLADLWRQLADPNGTSSNKIEETDWAAALNSPGPPIRYECRHYRKTMVARFVRDGKCNAEIQLVPGAGDVHRPGDSISGQPEGRAGGVPEASDDAADEPRGEEG